MNFKIETIKEAYKKFKSSVYYDNYNLFFRQQVADFEDSEIENKLQFLCDLLNSYSENRGAQLYLEQLIENIDFFCMPKKIKEDPQTGIIIVSNSSEEKSCYEIESATYLINAHIYIHIISVLWIHMFGEPLDSKMNNVYAYKINDDFNSKSLFKPYFTQYQSWRDESISKIKEINQENIDVIAFSLDIKDYYYSVNLDFTKLESELKDKLKADEMSMIFELMKCSIKKYSSVIKKYKKCSNNSLPIGLLSSGILANWYLKDFDQKILEELYPSYYGRYVDDILIVLRNYDKKKLRPEEYLKKYFIDKNDIFIKPENENDRKYQIKDYPLYIQETKLKIFDIYADGSKALINNFEKTIKNNSSEFRLLPEEKKVIDDFDEEAYTTIYSDSINKMRSLEDFKGNKYGVSKYLAKIMFSSRYWDDDLDKIEEITKQITTFFKGKLSIQFLSFWEKVFSYYVIRKKKDYIINFYNRIKSEINRINYVIMDKSNPAFIAIASDIEVKIKDNLMDHLNNSLLLPLALNPELFKNYDEFENDSICPSNIARYRRTNLIRDKFLKSPLINYTKIVSESKNLLGYYSQYGEDERLYEIDEKFFEYSPRFIHLNECIIYSINKMMYGADNDIENIYLKNNEYLRNAVDLYIKINNKDESVDSFKALFGTQYNPSFKTDDNYRIKQYILNNKNKNISKPKIGVVSIKVNFEDIENRFINKKNLSRAREQQLYKLLNLANEEKVDILILPEVSIPYEWMQILADVSRKNRMLIIAGFEHWIRSNKTVYNYLAVFVPFHHKNYQTCIIKIRNKNCFAPAEVKLIKKYGFQPHFNESIYYDLFKWNNITFSCYNCFELADIFHRSIFKSEVDLLFASEYNSDINYFSSIIESTVRDIHCYFVQVNTSDYGDSRILQPAKTEKKNILQLKGGENITILTASLDLKSLRKFQMQHEFDKSKDPFKPTPPNYDQLKARKRWNEGNRDD